MIENYTVRPLRPRRQMAGWRKHRLLYGCSELAVRWPGVKSLQM